MASRRGTTYQQGIIGVSNRINPVTLKPFSGNEYFLFNKITLPYLDIDEKTNAVTVRSNNCRDLDLDLKKIGDQVAEYVKIQTEFPQDAMKTEIDFLAYTEKMISGKFNQYNCADKIEQTELDEGGTLITQIAIEGEKQVIDKSDLETKIYIILGGVILVTALVILTNKNK